MLISRTRYRCRYRENDSRELTFITPDGSSFDTLIRLVLAVPPIIQLDVHSEIQLIINQYLGTN